MLEASIYSPCEDCGRLNMETGVVKEGSLHPALRESSQENGNPWSLHPEKSLLHFHGTLAQLGEVRHHRDGVSTEFRCTACGTLWAVGIDPSIDAEYVEIKGAPPNILRKYVHWGPWFKLLDMEGEACIWKIAHSRLTMRCTIDHNRINPAIARIIMDHGGGKEDTPIPVLLSASLTCFDAPEGLPGEKNATVRTITQVTSPPPERSSASWCEGILGKIQDALGDKQRLARLDQSRMPTRGAYQLNLGNRSLYFLTDDLTLHCGSLVFKSRHFFDETTFDEDYILWLARVLNCLRPPGELAGYLTPGRLKELSRFYAAPWLEIDTSSWNHAVEKYGKKELREWAYLVMRTPGLHYEHHKRSALARGERLAGSTIRETLEHISGRRFKENENDAFICRNVDIGELVAGNVLPAAPRSLKNNEIAERAQNIAEKPVAESDHTYGKKATGWKGVKGIVHRIWSTRSVNVEDSEGQTALLRALQGNDRESISLFISLGADVHVRTKHGKTTLHLAIENRDRELANYLLTQGVEVNAQDIDGKSSLHLAVANKNRDLAECLINHGAALNAQDSSGSTPLHSACALGLMKIVELLVQSGAEVNRQNTIKWTPLHVAVQKNNVALARYLIDNGASMNVPDLYGGNTELHRACNEGFSEMAKFLMQQGAEVNARDHHGCTPLFCALRAGKADITKMLIACGADYDICAASARGDMAQVRHLLGADPTLIFGDKRGLTPLHCAKTKKVAELLISWGAEITAKDDRGLTPLHCAATRAIAQLLIDLGANVNAMDRIGQTPLHLVTSFDIAELLIEHGARVRVVNTNGETPWHRAQKRFNAGNPQEAERIAKLLEQHGGC
jgi:ankyrin repeat protein